MCHLPQHPSKGNNTWDPEDEVESGGKNGFLEIIIKTCEMAVRDCLTTANPGDNAVNTETCIPDHTPETNTDDKK